MFFAARDTKMPDTPPPLDALIELSTQQLKQASDILAELSQALSDLPVVLSQDGEIVTCAGDVDEATFEKIARLTNRVWREGAHRNAREYIRFEEEVFGSEDERANLLLYSIHIDGGLTLSLGWQLTISLTQLRAEASDAKEALLITLR